MLKIRNKKLFFKQKIGGKKAKKRKPISLSTFDTESILFGYDNLAKQSWVIKRNSTFYLDVVAKNPDL